MEKQVKTVWRVELDIPTEFHIWHTARVDTYNVFS